MSSFGMSVRIDASIEEALEWTRAALPDLGLLLPCSVVVRADEQSGQAQISSLNPEIMVSVPDRPELQPIAADAADRLQNALAAVVRKSASPPLDPVKAG